ncbi:MAG: hypothetical protein PHG61_05080 [Candidatus Marinimicrobia bacterium]|nr:hypothetical protein [Candidatus Neomarinimicrobiota bacterium]
MPVIQRTEEFAEGEDRSQEGVKPDTEETEVEEETTEEETESNEEGTQSASPAEETDPSEEETVVSEPAGGSESEEKKKTQTDVDGITQEYQRVKKEVEDLKSQRRDLKGTPFKSDDLFVKKEEVNLDDIDKDDIEKIEKVLRAKGYVKKDEVTGLTLQKEIDSASKAWVNENEEFKPANDPNDEKWNSVVSYIKENFAVPRSAEKAREYLDIARERLFGKKEPVLPKKSLNSVAAKKEKLSVSAVKTSGGGASASSTGKTPVDPKLAQHFSGFSEDELKEILA